MTGYAGDAVTVAYYPLAVILERHCPSTRKRGNGQPIRGSLAASAILEEIPEGDYFLTTLTRGENISFEDDG